jgi:chromosome segregation and condensation protein ScpB
MEQVFDEQEMCLDAEGEWVRYEEWMDEEEAMCEADSNAVLADVLAELMEAIEKENAEEKVCGARMRNSDAEERKLEDINYGYELRFKKILGKYFS